MEIEELQHWIKEFKKKIKKSITLMKLYLKNLKIN